MAVSTVALVRMRCKRRAIVTKSVSGRLFDVFDHQDLDGALGALQFEAKLLAKSRDHRIDAVHLVRRRAWRRSEAGASQVELEIVYAIETGLIDNRIAEQAAEHFHECGHGNLLSHERES